MELRQPTEKLKRKRRRSRKNQKKLLQQGDEIYFPGKEEKADKKKDTVRDEVLERAVELLKARDVLGNLKPGK